MTKEEMKDRISFTLKDPILQQGFEIICKNLAELEKENAELKERIKWYSEQICNKECAEVWGELTKAKNHIHRLLVLLTEGKRSYAVIDEARAFLQEESE